MRHHFLPSTTTMPPSSSTTTTTTPSNYPSTTKPLKPTTTPPNSPNCKHSSPSATTLLDLLILILVLFSGSFLLTSYCSYIIHSFSLILPSITSFLANSFNPNHLYYVVFSVSFVTILTFFEICCIPRSRKCGKIKCKGLRKCMEFDLQLIKEGSLRSNEFNNGEKRKISSKNGLKEGSLRINECSNGEKRKNSVKNGVKEGSLRVNECKGGEKSKNGEWSVEEIDELPWKGGSESNPDYECLRAELRKMAPPNGKAVLLFRAKCGCPLAKLEGWGTGTKQRGKRLKKSPALDGGGDHR